MPMNPFCLWYEVGGHLHSVSSKSLVLDVATIHLLNFCVEWLLLPKTYYGHFICYVVVRWMENVRILNQSRLEWNLESYQLSFQTCKYILPCQLSPVSLRICLKRSKGVLTSVPLQNQLCRETEQVRYWRNLGSLLGFLEQIHPEAQGQFVSLYNNTSGQASYLPTSHLYMSQVYMKIPQRRRDTWA